MSNQSKSREMMFSKIREWQGSGVSQKTFCEQYKISYSNFHYWYKRFRDVDPASSSGFVPLQISDISADIFASIIFSSGHTLRLHQAVNPDYLKELLP
jgi:hypothetical protein